MAEQRLADLKTAFNRFCREAADPGVSDRFDEHGVYAQRALDRGDEKGADEAETHLGEMESLYMRQLWQEPGYIVSLFQRLAQEGYLAVDPAEYQRLVREGETALERNDIDGLRRSIFALWEAQINVGGVDKEMARLATIVRS